MATTSILAAATAACHARPRLLLSLRKPQACTHPQAQLVQPAAVSSSRRGTLMGLVVLLASTASPQLALAEEDKYTVSETGLAYCDILVGSGAPPVKGMLIKAHYTGKLKNGTVFDSSYPRGKPLTFKVGVGEVIKGWDQGILGGPDIPPMLPGGKRKLVIPAELAYAERGAGCRGSFAGSCIIPPNSVLLFDVELL